jgi:hypothetical protein
MTPTPDISSLLPDDETVRARRDALVREVSARAGAAAARPSARFTARPRLLLAVVGLFLLGAGGAVASGVLSADDVQVDSGIVCYHDPEIKALNWMNIPPAADPIAACAKLWEEGVGVIAYERGPGPAPKLVACARAGDPVHVFPSNDPSLCRHLKLEPLPADYAAAGAASERAYDGQSEIERRDSLGLLDRLLTGCASPQAMADDLRERLDGFGYEDVEVMIRGGKPCALGFSVVGDSLGVDTISEAEGVMRAKQAEHIRRLMAAAAARDDSPR